MCREGARWLRVVRSIARAFQPEICPLRLTCLQIDAGAGVLQAVGLTRSREAAKRNAGGGGVVGGGGAVFEYEYEVGRVCVFRARARIPQSAIRNTIGRGCPLTPDPSPRWGRGEDFVLWDI